MKYLIVLCLFISGCQTTSSVPQQRPQMPALTYEVDASAYQIPELQSLLTLNPAQVEQIKLFQQQSSMNSLPPYQQLKSFLQQRLVNFNYEGKNYNANEALALNQGNCMSLALLTHAIAIELGIDSSFQVMHTMPMLLDVTDRLAITSDHVRTFLYESEIDTSKSWFAGRNKVAIDYFPDRYDRGGRKILANEFYAMFYRNLAADAIVDDDLAYAYLLLKKSFSYSTSYAPAINMMAVVLRRLGDIEAAESMYLYGIDVSEDRVNLLSNYHFLLVSEARIDDALSVKKQLLELDDSSPYKWYMVAQDAIAAGDDISAKVFLSKFIDNTHYFHKAYFDLAKVHTRLGETDMAKIALEKAMEYAAEPQSVQRYQAKLAWLDVN